MQAITKLVAHGRAELAKVIVGQSDLVDGALIALLCGGHALIEGVPGLGKTLSVKILARSLSVGFQRVQCTSDLMPADLLGTNVLNLASGTFSLHRGPMFTDLLLVDEITACLPAPRRLCSNRWRSGRSRLMASATPCPPPSPCWRLRIQSSSKAPTRFRKRSSTASF